MKRGETGRYEVTSIGGEPVRAFVPAPLPPVPPVTFDGDLQRALEAAGLAVGRLDGVSTLLPDTALFLYAYVGDRAGTCIDPTCQVVRGRTVCVVSCQRSPEPVFLRWKGLEASADGDFFVRSGPGTVKLSPGSAGTYITARFAKRIDAAQPR